jgi:hypothetical protein
MSYGSPGLSSVGTTHRPLRAPGVAGAGKRQGSWAEVAVVGDDDVEPRRAGGWARANGWESSAPLGGWWWW